MQVISKTLKRSQVLGLALTVASALLSGEASAQATPSTEQMIEQLQTPAPVTRSLRNLGIQKTPRADAPAAGGGFAAPAPAAAAAPMAVATPAAAAPAAAPAVAATPAAQAAPYAPVSAPEPPPRPSLSLQIQFEFNAVSLSPQGREALERLARALLSPQLVQSSFSIEGHTDAKGSADYNMKLSQRRAEAVKEFLVMQGVGETRLSAVGKGFTELANIADPLSAENRRVRVINMQ